MEHLKAEEVESQTQLPQLEQPGKGTTFLKTCFNGVNTLSGFSLSLLESMFFISSNARKSTFFTNFFFLIIVDVVYCDWSNATFHLVYHLKYFYHAPISIRNVNSCEKCCL